MRTNLLRDRSTSADRNTDNDQVGAFDRSGVVFDNLIGKAKLGNASTGPRRARGCDNRPRRTLGTRRARNRRPDKTDTDEGQAIEQRSRFVHAGFPRNSLSACTMRRLASSVPTLIRMALGSLYAATCRRIRPRLVRNASASRAVLPFVSGKWISTKFAALGVTLRPSLPISSVNQASQRVLCARERSTWVVSLIAAMPAAMAGPFTLNGPRIRWTESTTCAGPYIQPRRNAASP